MTDEQFNDFMKRLERIEDLVACLEHRLGGRVRTDTDMSNQYAQVHRVPSEEEKLSLEAERNWHRDQALRKTCSEHDHSEAQWGRGPRAGCTGDPFVDDPFFNPWAPGGSFNK